MKSFFSHPVLSLSVLMGVGGLLVTGLGDSAPEVLAETPPAEHATEAAPAPETRPEVIRSSGSSSSRGGCLADEAAIEDMKKARTDVEAKRKEVADKENELKAREKALEERLKALEQTRDEIRAAQGVNDAASEEKIARLVETFEGMSPKSAAGVVANLDDGLAVRAMSRVSSQKLGKILSALEPVKSARLTELLAGVVRAKKSPTSMPSSVDVAETTNRHSGSVPEDGFRKGGENNGNNKQQPNIPVASRQPEPAVGREPANQKQ